MTNLKISVKKMWWCRFLCWNAAKAWEKMREKVKIEYSENSTLDDTVETAELSQKTNSQTNDAESESDDDPEDIGPMEARFNKWVEKY